MLNGDVTPSRPPVMILLPEVSEKRFGPTPEDAEARP